jgi:ethanolamine utilization protein EutN
MMLGKVTGTIWGAQEARTLDGRKLVQVQPLRVFPGDGLTTLACDTPAAVSDSIVVAVDELGAGIGEFVLVGHGSRIRDLTVGGAVPVKDVVLAIVDRAEYDAALVPPRREARP